MRRTVFPSLKYGVLMEFLITRLELQTLFHVSRSTYYDLHAFSEKVFLSRPIKWCGQKKTLFCLRSACAESAKLNGLETPSDETIKEYWSNILMMRQQEVLASRRK
jgi:hypothetical protein